jgi:hypothetical protein
MADRSASNATAGQGRSFRDAQPAPRTASAAPLRVGDHRLRLYDIGDAERPREVAYFVSPDPTERLGILPTELVAQTEDVLVDARGYAYVTDKNQGIYVVRPTTRH